jgi:hypothetical protein
MADRLPGRWFELRPARNLKPVTYRCPFCGRHLPALGDHVLVRPEGRPAGRRHAHTACVLRARERGELPTREEWRRQQRAEAGPAERPAVGFLARWRRRSSSG